MIDQEILNIYSDFVLSIYATGLTTEESICNCTLSMIGELAEWEETQTSSISELLEAGDVLYYLTQLLRELEIPVSFLATDLSFEECKVIPTLTAILSDRTKKHLFWGQKPKYNRHEYTEEIKPMLLSILKTLTFSFDLRTIIEANIDKLAYRKGVDNPLKGYSHD